MDRRGFLMASAAAASLASLRGAQQARGEARRVRVESPEPTDSTSRVRPSDLDLFIRSKMERDHIPSVAAAIFTRDEVVWQNTYGWADIEHHTPRTLDHLQNIGSVSKTFVTTAVLQLWEARLFDLDDDVNGYLPFRVENPGAPGRAITFRQLMTHTSSIGDGSAYSRLYACGDPRISLQVWLSGYFTQGGPYYSAEENFHPWAPGEIWRYCNVAYGLLAYLVERISGVPFGEHCRRNVFKPLGMDETSWYLADIDRSKHAVPYTWVENGVPRGLPRGVIRPEGPTLERKLEDGYQANCLYNHPNFPDGFLRTSVAQIVRHLQAYLRGGLSPGYRLLREETVRTALSVQLERGMAGDRTQGLTWHWDQEIAGEPAWGHTGRDPGINTDVRMLPSRGIGAVAFTNAVDVEPAELTTRLLESGVERLGRSSEDRTRR